MRQHIRLLLIDNEIATKEALQQSLQDRCQVVAVQSSEAVLSAMKTEHPDVIVLSLQVPGMDGVRMLKTVKNIDCSIPVIVISPVNEVDSILKVFRLGACDYFDKPLDIHELSKSIEHAAAGRLDDENDDQNELSVDMELFIHNAVDEMMEHPVVLDSALKNFREMYIDMVSSRSVKVGINK